MSLDKIMPQKIPIIYILSNGRSGSTLLDMVLGASAEAWTVGEAQFLPLDYTHNVQPCGCGASIKDCDFWQRVCPDIPLFQGQHPIEHFRAPDRKGKVLRWGLLQTLWTGRLSAKKAAVIQAYGRLNHDYFSAVLKEAQNRKGPQVRWLVDASKDPYRLLWLQKSGYFDVRVIHLTKDPRAFVYSTTRKEAAINFKKTVRMSGRWLIENALCTRACKMNFTPEQYKHIRYEDLASSPESIVGSLSQWLDAEFVNDLKASFREQENHAVSGNLMRWQKTDIKLDEKWKKHLPRTCRNIVEVITRPLSRAYGYDFDATAYSE